jgi:hypothetical protein
MTQRSPCFELENLYEELLRHPFPQFSEALRQTLKTLALQSEHAAGQPGSALEQVLLDVRLELLTLQSSLAGYASRVIGEMEVNKTDFREIASVRKRLHTLLNSENPDIRDLGARYLDDLERHEAVVGCAIRCIEFRRRN